MYAYILWCVAQQAGDVCQSPEGCGFDSHGQQSNHITMDPAQGALEPECCWTAGILGSAVL